MKKQFALFLASVMMVLVGISADAQSTGGAE